MVIGRMFCNAIDFSINTDRLLMKEHIEAELQQKNEEIQHKNAQLTQVQVLNLVNCLNPSPFPSFSLNKTTICMTMV